MKTIEARMWVRVNGDGSYAAIGSGRGDEHMGLAEGQATLANGQRCDVGDSEHPDHYVLVTARVPLPSEIPVVDGECTQELDE